MEETTGVQAEQPARSRSRPPPASAWLKIAIGLFAAFCAFFVLGYQGLKPALADAGALITLCPGNGTAPAHTRGDGLPSCAAQDAGLDNMFNSMASALNLSGLLSGTISFLYGPRVTMIFGCTILVLGCVLLGISNAERQLFDYGYVIMGAGGTLIGLPVFALTGLVPAWREVVTSLIPAMLDASAVIGIMFGEIHSVWRVPIQTLFLAYIAVPLFLALVSGFIFAPVNEQVADSMTEELLGPKEETTHTAPACCVRAHALLCEPRERPPPPPPLLDYQVPEEAKDENQTRCGFSDMLAVFLYPHVWVIVAWFGVTILAAYFFMQAFDNMARDATSLSMSRTDVTILNWAVPLAVTLTPLVGMLLRDLPLHVNAIILGVVALIQGNLPLAGNVGLIASAILYAFNRLFFFSLSPHLLERLFGDFGKNVLYAYVLALGALANFANIGLIQLAVRHNMFVYINDGLCAATLGVSLFAAYFLWLWARKAQGSEEERGAYDGQFTHTSVQAPSA
jgi:hypothetical protein